MTLASIVEKETGLESERQTVSGVYSNRLRRGMGLFADPTVIYALKLAETWDGNLRREDLQLNSPYNTYRFAGLPPGPICSPGVASLKAAAQPANPISRGLLLASLVDAMSLAEVEHRVRHLGLERYRPFAIAAFEPVGPPKSLRWNGSALKTEFHSNPGFVLTSSGATPPKLEETRRTIFTEAIDLNGLTATTLTQVHRDHRPERGPLSVRMHRPEAATVSYCHITVAGASGDILFRYAPGPPCTTSVQHPLTLPRVDRLAPT